MGPRSDTMTGALATAGVEESDCVLLARARSGDEEAFAALWRRHLPAAHAAATPYRGRVSAEDLVAEASARLFRLLSEGRGPSSNFRAYFVSTVRTVGVDAIRREMSLVPTSTTDLDLLPGPDEGLSALSAQGVDTDLVREAFLRLSEGDRRLLWQTMVEGHPPRVVAPELGVSANVASARAKRARDELRDRYLDSWLRRRVPVCDASDCRWTLDHLSGHVRGRLTERQRARVEAHLASCPRESGLARELQRVYDGFGALTGPLLFAAGATMLGGLPAGAFAALVGSSTTGATTGATAGATTGVTTGATAGAGAAGGTAGAGAAGTSAVASVGAGSTVGGAAAGSAGLGGTLTASGAGATASGAAAGAALTTGATSVSAATAAGTAAAGTATCAGAGGAVLAVPAAAGVAGTTALVSSAAIVTPVAALTGGSILAGTAIGPPLATAMAGLVVGLGLSVAPAAAHDLGTTTTSVVTSVDGATAVLAPGSGAAAGVGTTPVDVLHRALRSRADRSRAGRPGARGLGALRCDARRPSPWTPAACGPGTCCSGTCCSGTCRSGTRGPRAVRPDTRRPSACALGTCRSGTRRTGTVRRDACRPDAFGPGSIRPDAHGSCSGSRRFGILDIRPCLRSGWRRLGGPHGDERGVQPRGRERPAAFDRSRSRPTGRSAGRSDIRRRRHGPRLRRYADRRPDAGDADRRGSPGRCMSPRRSDPGSALPCPRPRRSPVGLPAGPA